MKKNLCLFSLLLLFSISVFAEVELSGEFKVGVVDAFTEDYSTAANNAEINLTAKADDFTTIKIELDAEGDDWDNQTVSVDDFRMITDLTGYLGIEAFDLTFKTGLYDEYFTNWNYVSRSGEEFYYIDADESDIAGDYLWAPTPMTDLAFDVNLGFDNYNVMYWMDYAGSQMSVAFSGNPTENLNFLFGYYSEFSDLDQGNIWVEGGLNIDIETVNLFIPAAFTLELEDNSWGWSSGVAADFVDETVHFAAGIGGFSDSAFDTTNIEISSTKIENADIYAIADMDFSESTAFQSIDFGGIYDFGGFGISTGYVVATSESVETIIFGDTSTIVGNGMYLFFDTDF